MKTPDIPTEECHYCDARGLLPAPGAGPILKRERIAAGVTILELLKHLPYQRPYIQDLERDRRNWTWGRVTQYRAAIAAVCEERMVA